MARPTTATLDVVWLRDQSRCFLCFRPLQRGHGGYSIHHRVPRGMGGSRNPMLNQPGNLLLLCGSGTDGCHGWVEKHRDESFRLGLLMSRLGNDEPSLVPVRRWGRQWVTVTNDGHVIPSV